MWNDSDSSVYGRGVYFATEKDIAESYAAPYGIVTKAYINLDDVEIFNRSHMTNSDYQLFEATVKEPELSEELEAYRFISDSGYLRDNYRDLYAIFHGYDVFNNGGNYTIFNRTKVGVEE